MKKMLVMLLCGMMLLNMIACQATHPNEGSIWETAAIQTAKETEADTTKSKTEETKIPEKETLDTESEETAESTETASELSMAGMAMYGVYWSMEDFLNDWQNIDEIEVHSILVPTMKSSDYYLGSIQVYEDHIFYMFLPYDKELPIYEQKDCFSISEYTVSDSYEELLNAQYISEIADGVTAYANAYIYNHEGRRFEVGIPWEKKWFLLEDVDDYFEFERVYSSSAETHAVQ